MSKPIFDRPLLSLGFRPFYLFAALYALVALPLWVLSWLAVVQPGVHLTGMTWHSHEMLFGFAAAVMAGFLLTAVRNWTSLPTPAGAPLAGLVLLWLVARVLLWTGPGLIAATVDVAFLPALGAAIAVPIWRSRNARNYKLLILIAALAGLNLLFHLAHLEVLPGGMARAAITGALDLITILMAVVGGRVIPYFTANAVPGARPRNVVAVEWIALGSLVLIFLAGLFGIWHPLPAAVLVVLLAAAAVANAIRLLLWEPLQTRGNPLLWMLPVAWAWIPVSLALRAFAEAGGISPIAATHALTVGAMGGLMLGMMMRSALGHSGRPLVAGPFEVAAFLLVQAAAIVRVFPDMIRPEFHHWSMIVSATAWTLAFAVFVVRFWPMLVRPRVA